MITGRFYCDAFVSVCYSSGGIPACGELLLLYRHSLQVE